MNIPIKQPTLTMWYFVFTHLQMSRAIKWFRLVTEIVKQAMKNTADQNLPKIVKNICGIINLISNNVYRSHQQYEIIIKILFQIKKSLNL